MACLRCELQPVLSSSEGARRPSPDEELNFGEADELFELSVMGALWAPTPPYGFSPARICQLCGGVYFPRIQR